MLFFSATQRAQNFRFLQFMGIYPEVVLSTRRNWQHLVLQKRDKTTRKTVVFQVQVSLGRSDFKTSATIVNSQLVASY